MKTAVLHQTDLYHPYLDADDHWDLACQYALAYKDDIDLKGVLLDYPPKIKMNSGEPAVQAVSQLNYITGLYIPMAIGCSKNPRLVNKEWIDSKKTELSGVKMILNVLRESEDPVTIQMVGSCRDIAIVVKQFPELVKEKCKAIFLNAGTGNIDSNLEYNTSLDPQSFNTVFNAPCPVYWMPSNENIVDPFTVETYGTYYNFKQDEILPYLSEKLKLYFTYALGRIEDYHWLSYLKETRNLGILDDFGKESRNMWSTAGILYATGKTVNKSGEIIPIEAGNKDSVFGFEEIEAETLRNGKVKWKFTDKSTNKYIFKIKDRENYADAMTKAMKSLLIELP